VKEICKENERWVYKKRTEILRGRGRDNRGFFLCLEVYLGEGGGKREFLKKGRKIPVSW
jgi:hypothetical protein